MVTASAQQIDTTRLKNEVLGLKTFAQKKAFLERIYAEDQKYRGALTKDGLDYQHLISISLYINEYAYPADPDFGACRSAPWLVWIHNKYRELDKLCFPIVLSGFLAGYIAEGDLRTYHLKNLYHDKFDNDENASMPLKKLFEVCEVQTGKKIPLATLVATKAEIDRFIDMEEKHVSIWKSDDTSKNFVSNGKTITQHYPGKTIRLFEKADGITYLQEVNPDGSGVPAALEHLSGNTYKIKGLQTDKYYEVQELQLLYKNSKETLEEFRKLKGD